MRLARRMLRDHAAAEDACQAAFMKAYTHGRDVEPGRLGAWMRRVVSNECLTRLRRRKVRREHMAHVAHHRQSHTPTPGPDRTGEHAEHAAWLLGQLEPELAEVVTLRVMRECSGQEAAELLGVSQSTISKRLHRGMQQLRDIEQQTHDRTDQP